MKEKPRHFVRFTDSKSDFANEAQIEALTIALNFRGLPAGQKKMTNHKHLCPNAVQNQVQKSQWQPAPYLMTLGNFA